MVQVSRTQRKVSATLTTQCKGWLLRSHLHIAIHRSTRGYVWNDLHNNFWRS